MPPWQSPASRRARRRRWLTLSAGAVACYLASYAAFSSWGQYVRPRDSPAPHPVWAPGEFYDFATGHWRPSRTLIYAPLLWLDQKLWHHGPAASDLAPSESTPWQPAPSPPEPSSPEP